MGVALDRHNVYIYDVSSISYIASSSYKSSYFYICLQD